jgi:pimeloyl-ACP methyl ester carboxylesterase
MAGRSLDYVHDYGGRGKVIVLLHGFLASSAYWNRLQPLLTTAGYRVITMDLLGFGRAPKPKTSKYAYKDHLRHIEQSLKRLDISEPAIVVGHSMGALIALRFARAHPERVSSLVLLHPPLYISTHQARMTLLATGKHYRFLLASRFRRFGWGTLRLLFAGQRKLRHTRRSRENSLRNIILAAQGMDDLKYLATRTLLVLGSYDREEYIQNMRHASLSEYVSVTIEPVSHHSPIRHSDSVFKLIRAFDEASQAPAYRNP